MNYKIIEVHCLYKNKSNELQEVAVLWESNAAENLVRATYAASMPCNGYKYIVPGEKLSPKLIQEIAGQGMNLTVAKKIRYFPCIKNWER